MVNNTDSSSPASLRRTHRGQVLSQIHAHPGISRVDLSRSLGFSDMAASRIIRELVMAGLVEEMEIAPDNQRRSKKRLGRPKIGLQIARDGLYSAGITVSAYHSEVSLSDANGVLIASDRIAYTVSDDIAATATAYSEALFRLIEATDLSASRIVGVGVALAARTSLEKGAIVRSDYFGWGADGGEFSRRVGEIVGLPVEIDNISNALAIAEMRFGVARDLSDFVLVHVATLIGAAVMSGGQLVRGKEGISGMLGHFRAEPTVNTCVCGRHDCLNLSATGFGVLSRMAAIETETFDRRRLEQYATSLLRVVEDGSAETVIREAGARLAPALDNVCKLLGPEKVVLSGYLGGNEHYIDGLRSATEANFLDDPDRRIEIVPGVISPTRAAALLALHTFCYSNRLDFEKFADTSRSAEVSGHG